MLLVATVCSLLAFPALSQNAYVKINAGYGLAAGTQTMWNTTQTTTMAYEAVNYSLGKGINAAGTFGFMFNKNFGAELNIGYLMGGETEITDKSTIGSNTEENVDIFKGSMVSITPAFIVESGFETVNPYARFGLVIGAMTNVVDEMTETSTVGSTTTKVFQKTEYKMDLGLGANAAFGLMYNVSESFGIFGECNMNLLNITPKTSEITEFTVDGTDRLADLTVSEKQYEYEKEYTYDPANPGSTGSPSKSIKMKMPFSSVGANIGVKISF